MPLNRLPDYISSNISLTGVSADYLDGVDLTTISSSLRSNHAITGGGTITFDASANLLWTTRFIIISNGRGPFFSTVGYYDIDMPSAGTVITGVGGTANKTVSASGISLNVWEALYYILPIGGIQVGLTSNFRIALYTSDLEVPHNWVLIAVRNGDNNLLYLNNGIILELGKSQNGSIQSYLKVGTSNTENYIAFRGTTGDEPGTFTHTYIGERVYGGAEQSELVLFKGNDNDLTSGPDRIRSIAAHHVFDTYTSPLSGSFSAVAASGVNVTRMIIREGGNVGIGTTSPHTIGASSTPAMLGIIPNATTTVGLVVRGIASQSANLQEWQNNTPTTVASISNTGAITAVDLTLSGNLTVNGTTTNINTTNLVVEDKNIILGDVATPSNTTADGGGITLKGATDKTFNWVNSTGYWTSNVGIEASSFVKTSGTSAQFLKADGTVDSTTYAPLASPSLTGTPLSTTAAVDTNTTQIATTAYVVGQGYAKLVSPTFTGTVNAAAITTTGTVAINTAGTGTINLGDGILSKTSGTGFQFNSGAVFTSTISASGLAGSLLTSTVGTNIGAASAGTSTIPARSDHVHPTTGLGLTASGLNQFAATTSAQLAGVISDETGSGSVVFGTGPTMTLPVINNYKTGYTTTVTAAGTTTLTSASNKIQFFTGTTTQTVVLPVTSTLATGMQYEIHNNSTGTVTVQSSGLNTVVAVTVGHSYLITCIGTALTTAADWDADFMGATYITGFGSVVLNTSPTLVTPSIGAATATSLTTSGAINLNYASPAITSNNASAASIFTSTVTGITIGASAIKTTEYPAAPSGTTSGTVTQSAQLNGYVGMPQNPQATSGTFAYTFAASDAGKHIYATGTPSSVTFTIPANSAVAFEIGTTFVVMNDLGAATNISIAITTDTLQLAGTGTTGTRTLARYGVASITKVTATKWIISGNGLT